MKKCKNLLFIKTSTWNKESNELHDYESQDKSKSILETKTSGFVIKELGNDLKFLPISELKEDTKDSVILSIDCNEDTFFLKKFPNIDSKFATEVNSNNAIWLVVKNFKSNNSTEGYPLVVGDVIKIGRVKLKIRDIKTENQGNFNYNSPHLATKMNDKTNIENLKDNKDTMRKQGDYCVESKELYPMQIEIKKKAILCRICYCDEADIDSPLIQPCSCSGTMKYIHLACLQKWLKSKIVPKNTTNESCLAYSLKQIECELCKSLLPDFIKHQEKFYDIWDFKPKFKSYFIFETMITEKNTTRVIYVVNMEKKDRVRLGRGHDSDIRLSDISVSRFHAFITKDKKGKFVLKDNDSKFGTLTLMQHPKMPILKNNTLLIQTGRTIISFSIKANNCVYTCFGSKTKYSKNTDYQTLNADNIFFEKTNYIKIQDDCSESGDYDTNSIANNEKNESLSENTPHEPVFFKEVNEDIYNENNSQCFTEMRDVNVRRRLERLNTNEFSEFANNITTLNLVDIRQKVHRDLIPINHYAENEGEASNNDISVPRNIILYNSITYEQIGRNSDLNQINIEMDHQFGDDVNNKTKAAHGDMGVVLKDIKKENDIVKHK